MPTNFPFGPPMNTDNDYYQTFLAEVFVSHAKLQYLSGEEKPVLAL